MDALHDDVPIVVVDVKIPMTPITHEISASVVYMDWMILILDDETPSFDNQTAKQVQCGTQSKLWVLDIGLI